MNADDARAEVERAKEWAATLESVLADVYTILLPHATGGTHAANSPILRAYDILNSQDFDKWQASRPFTEEDVEAGAAAMWDRWGHPGMFKHAPVHRQNSFRADARAALDAVTARHTKGDDR